MQAYWEIDCSLVTDFWQALETVRLNSHLNVRRMQHEALSYISVWHGCIFPVTDSASLMYELFIIAS